MKTGTTGSLFPWLSFIPVVLTAVGRSIFRVLPFVCALPVTWFSATSQVCVAIDECQQRARGCQALLALSLSGGSYLPSGALSPRDLASCHLSF